jgi:hypothetical protein
VRQYKRNRILKLSFDYGVTEVARDSVLEYFLRSLASPDDDPNSVREYSDVITELSKFDDKSPTEKMRVLKRLQVLSDHIIDDFFLPCEFFLYTRRPRCISFANQYFTSEGCVCANS